MMRQRDFAFAFICSLVVLGCLLYKRKPNVSLTSAKVYKPPLSAKVDDTGKRFEVSDELMTSLGLPWTSFEPVDREHLTQFVFVVGASSNHFEEAQSAVSTVQHHAPQHKIFYYDLGLTDAQISQVRAFCNVVYKKFDFDKYPTHVRKLTIYAFKPLVIQEVLRNHSALIWMDASFRLMKSVTSLIAEVEKTVGFLQFHHSPHSNFAVTDPRLYHYLPTDRQRQKRVGTRAAGAVYIFRSREIYWGIIHWWLLCALDVNCMAPKGSKLHCDFSGTDNYSVYVNCHRFDMSALGVLASNMFAYNESLYTCPDRGIVRIARSKELLFPTQKC